MKNIYSLSLSLFSLGFDDFFISWSLYLKIIQNKEYLAQLSNKTRKSYKDRLFLLNDKQKIKRQLR